MHTVSGSLRWAERRLRDARIGAGARLEATLLLGHVLRMSRVQVLAALTDELSAGDSDAFRALVARRANGEPLQYLRGRAPFLDFEVEVRPGVFIPRPETEQLVERALRSWPDDGSWAVEVGTGSGAIAIGLARARPSGRVLSIDMSPSALQTAARNIHALGVGDRVTLVRGDLLGPLGPHAADRRGQPARIGVLVSNPPYVADGDPVEAQVRRHEPREAWHAGPGGLEAYEQLISQAADVLPRGAALILELGAGQDGAVSDLLRDAGGFEKPSIEPDFRGVARVLATRRAVA